MQNFRVAPAGMLLAAGLFLSSSGCNSVQRAADRVASLTRGESPAKADSDAPSSLDQPKRLSASEKAHGSEDSKAALDPRVGSALASAAWVATVPKSDGTLPANRWRHPLLEALPPEEHLEDIRTALASEKPLVAANARLALARYAKESTPDDLVEIIRQRSHPLPVRLAAVESLGKSSNTVPGEQLRQLIDELAPGEGHASPNYLPELHAEILYALTAGSEFDAQRCVAALASPAANVRLAAIRSWLAIGSGPLPPELLDRRTDADPRVRGVVLEAIGKWPPDLARDYLASAMNDSDLTVRLAAIGSLGKLKDEGSLKDLRRLLDHDAELVRAAAVASLFERGEYDVLLSAADDTAWHVRATVARLMARHHSPQAAELAARLLSDASPHVQQQMAASLADWPMEQAGPLLLSAMGESAFLMRKAARDELARRWPAAEEFSIDAPADSRAAKLVTLRQCWQGEFGVVVPAVAQVPAAMPAASTIAPLLEDLKSQALDVRRRAADHLAEQATQSPLNVETAEALCQSVTADSDALVWRSALTALANNTSEPAMRLATAGLSHPAAEVRRRSCEYFERHPDPAHAAVLLKSLEDPDGEVLRAAVRALAKSGAPLDPAPVERLLAASDRSLRVEAAELLVQANAASGHAALERLARDADPAIRRQAAAAMGRCADPASLPLLIKLLEDQGGVRQAALASLTQIAGKDVTRVDQETPPANSIEEVRRWRTWFEQRQ